MLGFGFNKAKVLASAEKNAKQGRLQNAIADYERVLKEEPNDLNVLNTIGDLYAHVGNIEQATSYFQRVGDAYASEGFTVKAIAMYKKLTKQNPNALTVVLKLAELYAQQGLNNDARVQYTAVAEHHLRAGDAESAAGVFQKILDLDPDNPQMQGRLAEIYGRLGKKVEARDVYFRSAQTLRARGALEACDDALGRVLKLDPAFAQAVLLRAQVRLEANDAKGAVQCLEALADLDSRPEALRVLLRAQLKLGQRAEAEPAARKLLTVFNETGGIIAFCDWLMANGDFENALHCYDEYATQLLTSNTAAMLEALHRMIGPLKSNSRALETLSALFQKAGNTTHLAEVTELLAHASVQDGALAKARDLYKKLAEMEPENPLHMQNFNQILSRIETDSGVLAPPPEQGEQALMADELDEAAAAVEQTYSDELAAALQNAFTDAELFESYNLPARAVPPLEAMLSRAPRDLELNRRLASLYVRSGRFAEAAQRCQILASVYGESGCTKEAAQFQELAARYTSQAPSLGGAAPPAPAEAATAEPDWSLPAGLELTEPFAPAPPAPPVAPVTPPAAPADAAHEIDLSDEWERVLAEQSGAKPVETVPVLPAEPEPVAAQSLSSVMDAALSDLVEEARFYLSQAMVEEARAALARAEALSPKAAVVRELRADLDGASQSGQKREIPEIEVIQPAESAEAPSVLPLEPGLLEVFGEDATAPSPADSLLESTGEIVFPEAETAAPEISVPKAAAPVAEPASEPIPAAPPAATPVEVDQPALSTEPQEVTAIEEAPEVTAAPAADEPAEDLLTDLVAALALPPDIAMPGDAPVTELSELELEPEEIVSAEAPPEVAAASPEILKGEELLPASVPAEPETAAPAELQPEVPGTEASADVLGDFVQDLEESLGNDFELGSTEALSAPPPAAGMSSPEALPDLGTRASSPQASAGWKPAHPGPEAPGQPVIPVSTPAEPVVAPPVEPLPAEESAVPSGLSDLFAEFKQEVESSNQEDDDPETHYNLGVAFKEMGLLDEAIGELQKVCKAVEHGRAFSKVIEAFTWLADCFVQNGMPEAGVHWYEKALQVPGLDTESVLAIHYELACAQEAAGDLVAARRHFMRVLSNNIDYRDVAERIKNLKS